MARCFVIQPFDGGRFDKRFKDVFEPAISEAGLEAYRIDRDPGATVLIDDIESGIRGSDACLADITTNNPNVWFELGLAIAGGKDVVLVCSTERAERYPFDVQHRAIIQYGVESPSDFGELHKSIVERLRAIQTRREQFSSVAALAPVRGQAGLSAHEVVALVVVAEHCLAPADTVHQNEIEKAMRKAGVTQIAVTLSVRGLLNKELVEAVAVSGDYDHQWTEFRPSPLGIQWLIKNQEKLVLEREAPGPLSPKSDEEIPF